MLSTVMFDTLTFPFTSVVSFLFQTRRGIFYFMCPSPAALTSQIYAPDHVRAAEKYK